MDNELLKSRKIVKSYFVKEPIKLYEIRNILNKLPDDYDLVSVEEILNFNGFNETPHSTFLPIIEINVDDENKEIYFYTKRAYKNE